VNTRFLQLAHHTATGVQLSDTTFRFVALKQHDNGVVPERFAELQLPEKCFENGVLASKQSFVSFLKNTKKAYSIDTVYLSLLSSQVLTWSVSARGDALPAIKASVEKELSLALKDIVYEHKAISGNGIVTAHQVTAMPKAISQDIVSAFKSAGITILTIEPVGHALARALLSPTAHQNALIIDIDQRTTSVSLVTQGKVSQTTLIPFGDEMIMQAIVTTGVVADVAAKLKREQGLAARESRTVFDAVVDDCAILANDINGTYIAWRKEHESMPAVQAVYLTGAGSALRGLDEYLSAELRLPVQVGNVWANCLSFDEHIPVLEKQHAVRYAAAIGAALIGGDAANLLPDGHKQSLRRKHVAKTSGKVLLSFILGLAVGFIVAKAIANPVVHTKIMGALHKIQARW
jgi:Tfp pilus assembly PilM family ATPase